MQVLEKEIMSDTELEKTFKFSCRELAIRDEVLPQVHQMLLQRMIHTHGNELIQRHRMLENIEAGQCVDAPLMLRDSLKVLAVQHKVSQ